MAQFTLYNKHSAPPSSDSTRVDCEHVPLCSINDVQLRFLVPDDLTEDKGILPDSMGRSADVGYILSLGVHRSHRRNGIGSLLLDALMNHLTTAERHSVKAIFLHTLTTNQPAIFFYEKRRFTLHSFLPYYYNIRGKGKDGFTYVNYINGGHPPWTLLDHIKHYASKVRHTSSLCAWVAGRVHQVVRWFYHKLLTRFNFIE
ncbi:N-alpha-acetyltransferase 60 isoform X3 [Drosophila santomea]|uniref:N-alpha-acetyltransferase 60 isoform X3 n=1 Tax=Drosophila santomea TaxID=129105 RepID=UPI0019544C71|nr:N-alpha-acetyltransferase 60 isoform X3 [Drosophila santomea]